MRIQTASLILFAASAAGTATMGQKLRSMWEKTKLSTEELFDRSHKSQYELQKKIADEVGTKGDAVTHEDLQKIVSESGLPKGQGETLAESELNKLSNSISKMNATHQNSGTKSSQPIGKHIMTLTTLPQNRGGAPPNLQNWGVVVAPLPGNLVKGSNSTTTTTTTAAAS